MPLEDLRVLEIGQGLAGPMAATLLGDFGADVIKLEPPLRGDSHRHMGPHVEGVGLWWAVTGRNKRSIAIDLKCADGVRIALDLLAHTDVLIENYRPGVIGRLGLTSTELKRANPELVVLHVSGFGQTGPYRERRGFGKIAEAFSGATNLTGTPGTPPVHPGYSLGDVVCGVMGAFAVLLALKVRSDQGFGQEIDLALYEPLLRLIEWQVPIHALADVPIARNGNRFPIEGGFITDIAVAADGKAVVLSAATMTTVSRLRALLQREAELDEEAATLRAIAEAVRRWLKDKTAVDAVERLEAEGLVAGLVYTPADILADPHVTARQNIVEVAHEILGSIPMPGVIPKLSDTPGAIRGCGVELGADTGVVLREILQYSDGTLDALVRAGVIGGIVW